MTGVKARFDYDISTPAIVNRKFPEGIVFSKRHKVVFKIAPYYCMVELIMISAKLGVFWKPNKKFMINYLSRSTAKQQTETISIKLMRNLRQDGSNDVVGTKTARYFFNST